MSDVFVSYKRENLAAVGRLVEGLRAEGIGVWWDQDIPPNAAWEATIEQQLAVAKVVIVAWSPAAVASDNVKAEARWARQQGRLLQVFVEACEPPLFFGERQGVDLKHWSGAASHAGFRTVLEAVRHGLASTPAAAEFDAPAAAPLALPSKPSVAVMPFANLSGDPEQEYFSDGMVEEVVNALSRFRSIFVIASGSTFAFKGTTVAPQEVARLLGVRYVLEGSVRRAGSRVRIAVKLIDASDGAQIWGDRFEDTLEDVFALQDKVALSVAGVIEPAVIAAEIRRASARPTENMGSYDLFLRSRPLFSSFGKPGVFQALDLLARAIALDPNYGSALALAAQCHMRIVRFAWSDDPEANRRQAIELAHRARRAAGDDDFVLALVAYVVASIERDHQAASALIARAILLNPGSWQAWFYGGAVRLQAGDADGAVENFETVERLDPISAIHTYRFAFMGQARFQQRRFSEAAALLKAVIQQVDSPHAYGFLAASHGHLGQTAAAREALARLQTLSPQTIDAFARTFMDDPTDVKLFLDGIALAEGKTPADIAGSTPAP